MAPFKYRRYKHIKKIQIKKCWLWTGKFQCEDRPNEVYEPPKSDCFLSLSFLAYYICFDEQKNQVNQKKIKFWVILTPIGWLIFNNNNKKSDTLFVILYHGLMSRTMAFNVFVFDQISVIIRKCDTDMKL